MRQRLGIAQAIMENPSALILDEPFNGLDKHSVADMRRLIKELRQQGKTIVLASHNKADIDELCDTVCEMDAGVMSVIR
jgi:ABC-2 type transport system ATP-binding protein